MRPAIVLTLAVLVAAGVAAGQRPTKPPTFADGDTEGLVSSPNPDIRHAWKRKVFWKVSPQDSGTPTGGVPRFTAAERTSLGATLDALTGVFKATPAGASGEGFWVLESRTFGYSIPFNMPAAIPPARAPLVYSSGFFPMYHEDIRNSGTWRLSVNVETESVFFYFNVLPESLAGSPLLSEPRPGDRAPAAFYLRPRVTATWRGLPIYEGRALVVSRQGRDPWAALPYGRALKAALGPLEKDRTSAETRLAGLRKTRDEVNAPAWEQGMRDQFEKHYGSLKTTRPDGYAARLRSLEHEIRVRRQQAEADANPPRGPAGSWYWNPVDAHDDAQRRLAALGPGEADEPACFIELTGPEREGRYTLGGSIVPERSAPGCRQLVRTNWEYFDVSLPRTAPQILYVSEFGRCATVEGDQLVSRPIDRWDAPPQGCVQHAQMWRDADWSALAALVVK
ncbi:MAG: hypothetical protein KJ066_23605 [Acidobacteria bacterium]|nr:hypothetical protein [Acidobacteriota bacterium]